MKTILATNFDELNKYIIKNVSQLEVMVFDIQTQSEALESILEFKNIEVIILSDLLRGEIGLSKFLDSVMEKKESSAKVYYIAQDYDSELAKTISKYDIKYFMKGTQSVHEFINTIVDTSNNSETKIESNTKRTVICNIDKEFNTQDIKDFQNAVISIGPAIIAVGGTKEGAGTTNMAINIAKYLRQLDKKVALLEMNNKPVLKGLSISGIDIYAQNYIGYKLDKPVNFLNEINIGNYTYIVIDLGCLYSFKHESVCSFSEKTADKVEYFYEMNRSHISVLVHPIGQWNLKYFTPFMMDKDFQNYKWKVALLGSDKESEDRLKEVAEKVYVAPMPFNIRDEETVEFMQDMLKEIMSVRKPKKKLLNKISIFKRG